MKKVLLVVLTLIITATVANAASLHGEYEGNPIVKVTNQGKELIVEDVPAISYNGRTMVPIYLLRQIGADVVWNAETYSVDVNTPQVKGMDVEQLAKNTKSSGVDFVGYFNDGNGFSKVTFYLKGSLTDLQMNQDSWTKVTTAGAYTDASLLEINDPNDNLFQVPTKAIRDYFSGLITAEQLVAQYEVYTQTQAPQQTLPQQTVPTITTQEVDNTKVCKAINDEYDYLMVAVGQKNLTMGQIKNERLKLEYARDQELAKNGCQ